ncbi:iron chelate uptake ABC transporter family permease subunit [Streptococcus sp. 11273D007BW]|nr:iron chelate uptake ABC transporter family permease subunit [Streptococcus sp.]MDY3824051.1 iron chelate uptake ABC transporter family permease subunit [Streptococcus sp.]
MRLPAILAILSSSLLAVLSTLILQTLSKNDLAEPTALGYQNVAITTLALLYLYSPAMRQLSYWQILFLSTLFVLLFSIFMYRFSKGKNGSLDGTLMLLVGIGANSFLSTILSYLKTYSPEIKDIFSLLMQGNFDHIDLDYAVMMGALTTLVVLMFVVSFPYFKFLFLDEETLYGLGISVRTLHVYYFFLMSFALALGLLLGSSFPFVAFTSLYVMRPYYQESWLLYLLSSSFMTANAILLSDLLAHYAFSTVLPTNIFLGFFGALGFIIILLKRRSE